MEGIAKKLRILLVEEQLKTVEQLAKVVTSGISDLRVAITASASAAIEQLRSHPPDLMILDLNLRRGKGIEVLQEAKALAVPPTIVALLNASPQDVRQRALQIGADYILENGRDTDLLAVIIRSLSERTGGAHRVTDENRPPASAELSALGESLSELDERDRRDQDDSAKRMH